MNVAVTGASGFIGQYIVRQLVGDGHRVRAWFRPESHRETLGDLEADVTWVPGGLADSDSIAPLLSGVDAVVHGALYRANAGFRGTEGHVPTYAEMNIVGSLRLFDAAHAAGIPRFVFISTCAVHEVVLQDRTLDECHPMWPNSHYGAHKGALEMFVHSYGLRNEWNICALRPTGVYGLHHLPKRSKWFDVVRAVARGDTSSVTARGGKEVHVADVAAAAALLLSADGVAGQSYNCYDHYISEQHVGAMAARLSGQDCTIEQTNPGPKNQIDTSKIKALGMKFGGAARLERTIAEYLAVP
jgi:nucleoside-diphosphate-sugar epimerase